MSGSSKAVVLRGTMDVRIEERPRVDPGPDAVVIRPRAVGICGSDVDMYRGVYTGLWRLPVIIGHEFSGEVIAKGSNVHALNVGDRVTSEEMHWCGVCRPCKAGQPNFCENLAELGFTTPGALAEEVTVHQKYVHRLPAGMSDESGSVVEPASVAYTGIFVQGGGLIPGDFVAVFGAGPIGQLSAMLAKAAGAEVCVFEPNEWRRKMARDMGCCDHVHDPRDADPVRVVKDLTGGYGAHMAIECSANENVVPVVVECLRFRGKGVLIGMLERPSTISGVTMVRRGISLVGSLGHSGHDTFPHVIDLIGRGEIDPAKMITHRFSIWDAREALGFAAQRGDSLKVTLTQ